MRNTAAPARAIPTPAKGHPNADVLARKIDGMEGAEGGLVLGSGMAAVTLALLGAAQAGDHVLGGDQLYGRSLRLMSETLPRMGIATSLADPTDAGAMEAALCAPRRNSS
jgi:O-acetylhomoserine/O-acetylserine sulfhydrylase-like pyridoxal-dependent enzyme